MGKTVKFQVKVQLSPEVSGSRRSAAAAAAAFPGSEHGACGPNACMYRLALDVKPARKGELLHLCFWPLSFVLKFLQPPQTDPRLVSPRGPAITAEKKKKIIGF